MTGFWPTGPITTFSMVVVFATATVFFIWGRREQRFIAAALLVSWVGARLATATSDMIIYVSFLTVAAGLALTPFTVISRYIGLIYGLRIVIVLLLATNVASWFWLWELNRVLVWVQILLAWGTISSGPGRVSRQGDNRTGTFGRWRYHHIFSAIWPQKPHLQETNKAHGKADS